MNPDENSYIIIKKESSISDNYSYLFNHEYPSLEQNLKIPEQIAYEKLTQGITLNLQCQERLELLLSKIDSKLKQNKEKLEKIDKIIAYKNKRNKIQLKKKQIEFYQFEDSKSSPEILRVLDKIRTSKRKKNFSSLYKNLYQGSSSEEDEEADDGDKSDDSDEERIKQNEKLNNKLGLKSFLQNYKDQEPKSINWVSLAKKANNDLQPERQKHNTVITGIQLYREFIAEDIQKKRSSWSEEDDEKLKIYVEIHGLNNWKQVANNIDGKNTSLCFQRWAKFVNPQISKGRWNNEEDIRLVLAVEAYKVGNWISVASLFNNRTDVQVRERWCNILDPVLRGAEWSKEEDNLLMLYVQLYDKKWSKIAKALKTRTDNQCWRRYKMLAKPTKKKESIPFPIECLAMKIDMKRPFSIIRKAETDNSSSFNTPDKKLLAIKNEPESITKKELSTEKKSQKKRKVN